MATTSALCTSFKVEALKGVHNFTATTGNTFKLALYTSSATMGAATTAFSTNQEASGTNYSSGGSALTAVTPVASGTTALCDFSDLTFGTATVTARSCMIYNDLLPVWWILVETRLALLVTLQLSSLLPMQLLQ